MQRTTGGKARPITHRDADGGRRVASDWESLTERLIREAQQEGRFDDLPGQGQRLRLDDDSYAGEMASANRMLRNAGAAPPWIETDKRIRELRRQIDALLARARGRHDPERARLRAELARVADQHDMEIARLETLAPSVRQHRRRLDRDELRRRVDSASVDEGDGE